MYSSKLMNLHESLTKSINQRKKEKLKVHNMQSSGVMKFVIANTDEYELAASETDL